MAASERFYLYWNNQAIWRITHAALREVGTIDFDEWKEKYLVHAGPLLSPRYNRQQDQWVNSTLPAGLYSLEGDSRISSEWSEVHVMDLEYADEDEMIYWREKYLS
jgi:hypothetical protein